MPPKREQSFSTTTGPRADAGTGSSTFSGCPGRRTVQEGAWHTLPAGRHRAAARRRFSELVGLLRDGLGVAPMFSWRERPEDQPRESAAGLRA